MDLASKSCEPFRDGMAPLTRREVFDLLKEIPEWSLEKNGHLCRRFTLKNFKECLDFIHDLVHLAELEDHYPNLCIEKSKHVDVSWYTYECGGLSLNDFIMASKLTTRFYFVTGGAL